MIIGISGTRRGLTDEQHEALGIYLAMSRITKLIHGGCHGVDSEADALFRKVRHSPDAKIDVYPAIGSRGIFAEPDFLDIQRPPLERNRIIVAHADAMIIVPAGRSPHNRSGTWMTYRESLRRNRLTIVIMPDGSTRLAPLKPGLTGLK